MNLLLSLIKADYKQRTRSYAFLITLAVTVYLAYTFVPPPGANYTTVRVGDYVGEYNSAWIGYVTAIMTSTFLSLFGFYLVNNSIKRDVDTGVGMIISTTQISNFKYLLSKTFSNFFVLLTMLVIVMGMALALVFIRGNAFSFDAMQFFLPYVLLTIPCLFFIAALAVVAEVFLSRLTVLQNVGYFIFFSVITSSAQFALEGNGALLFDLFGTRFVTSGMEKIVTETTNQFVSSGTSVGFNFGDKAQIKTFHFAGLHWPVYIIIVRLMWIAIGFLLLAIAAKFFHRFERKELMKLKKQTTLFEINRTMQPLKEIHLNSLPEIKTNYSIVPLIKTEILMLLRKGPRWFWFINIGGWIALVFVPLKEAHLIVLPVLWFLQINRWSELATKEKFYRIHYFSFSSYKPLQRLLVSQVIAASVAALLLALPIIMRYSFMAQWAAVLSIITGAVFVVSLAVFLGIVTGGKKMFEVVYFMLTYINLNAVPIFDYFGALQSTYYSILIVLGLIVFMLLISFIIRKLEMRRL